MMRALPPSLDNNTAVHHVSVCRVQGDVTKSSSQMKSLRSHSNTVAHGSFVVICLISQLPPTLFHAGYAREQKHFWGGHYANRIT